MTTSNSTFVDLIKKLPSKELRLLESKYALVFTCTKVDKVVTMDCQPPPHPPIYLKLVPSLFVLFPYMLCHYGWEKDTIDGFKSKLQQYKKFEDDKWDDWVEDMFMSSYAS
jgi:hypothetical protein